MKKETAAEAETQKYCDLIAPDFTAVMSEK